MVLLYYGDVIHRIIFYLIIICLTLKSLEAIENFTLEEVTLKQNDSKTIRNPYLYGNIMKIREYENLNQYHEKTLESVDKINKLVAKFSFTKTKKQRRLLKDFCPIIDEIMDVDDEGLRIVQYQNHTLDNVLRELDQAILESADAKPNNFEKVKNFVVITFSLKLSNITGLMMLKTKHSGQEIYKYKPIYTNNTLYDVVTHSDLEAAVYITSNLRTQILHRSRKPNVAITIFHKNNLFQQETARSEQVMLGVQINDFQNITFESPLKLIYAIKPNDVATRRCAHWGLERRDSQGSWRHGSSANICRNLEFCNYYHVTHFGMLIMSSDNDFKKHKPNLDMITNICSILSLIGIFGVFLTSILFKQWRQQKGNIILLQFTLSTGLLILILYISDHVAKATICDQAVCVWTALLSHYIVLVQFFWTLVISYLQYKRYVQIIGQPITRVVLKTSLIGWGIPLPIIVILGTCFSNFYEKSSVGICYPTGAVLYVAVLLPILIIIMTNLTVIILIAISIFRKNLEAPRIADNLIVLKLRLLLTLFFQLCITWLFGLLGYFNIAFLYMFCLTATLQGLVIFLLFIVFNDAANIFYCRCLGFKTKVDPMMNVSYGTNSASTNGTIK